MSTKTHHLPTLDRLNAVVPTDLSPTVTAENWLVRFRGAIAGNGGSSSLNNLFLPDAFWKDAMAFTSDFRTIHGQESIQRLIENRVKPALMTELCLCWEASKMPVLRTPFPDLALLQACFDFKTSLGNGTGVVRLVPVEGGDWKAYTLYTCLDSLSQFPEQTGIYRDSSTYEIPWSTKRSNELELTEQSPSVLIIGGGHSGLETAARLKALGVSSLIVEKSEHVGSSWTNRYKSLWLHDPVWYNQLPYMPLPSTWPVYCPGAKLGYFLQTYAKNLELNVWTSSTVSSADYVESDKKWTVNINRGSHSRSLIVQHLVFATGLGGGTANMPQILGMHLFQGEVFHSSKYSGTQSFAGKKVIVVGAGNSAHDICEDLYRNGAQVTMYQRSSTFVISRKTVAAMLGGVFSESVPTDVSDRLNASFPLEVAHLLHQRVTPALAKALDGNIIEGLSKTDFKTNLGPEGAGLLQLLLRRAGGYYVDTGASQLIIDGHIRVKNGSAIMAFTQSGITFEDGTHLNADAVIFATGFGDPRAVVSDVCGPDVAAKLGPVWGVNAEGELKTAWRATNQEGLWFAIGNLALSRFYSSFLAMQIKAINEKVLPPRYIE